MDDRDVLERAKTALENIADYEKKHGRGINLTPIITDLASAVTEIKALCGRAIDVLENDGEYHKADMSETAADPWDEYRTMLDEYIESYTNPMRFKELRDVEVFQKIMRERTPEEIATVLLVAINRLSADR